MVSRSLYENRIKKYIGVPVIKVITGMRRTGKTYFLRQIQEILKTEFSVSEKNIVYIDKENKQFRSVTNALELEKYIDDSFAHISGKKYICIDEVQEIENWEKSIRSYAGENNEYEIFITGSNATLLSGELSSFLTGRFIEFPIYSLSFQEFLAFRGEKKKSLKEEFLNFMKYGGLPGIHLFPLEEEPIRNYISGVFHSIVFRDIVSRYNLRNPSIITDIFHFLAENIGNIVSVQKIKNFLETQKLEISLMTLREYLQYFETTFLIDKVRRYDLKGKKILELYEKYYLHDLGLRSYFLGFVERDRGRIIENIVYLELCARGYAVSIGKIGEMEIDFIAEKMGRKEFFQVTASLEGAETRKREIASLQRETSGFPKKILSLDEFAGEFVDGIPHQYLIDWLLEE